MAKPCKVCTMLPRTQKAVNLMLARGATPGAVAKRFKGKCSTSGVRRHVNEGHVVKLSPEARKADLGQIQIEHSSVESLQDLMEKHLDIHREARATGQLANANAALREIRSIVEALSVLSGEAAQAKMMSMKDVAIDERLVTNFLEAALARPSHVVLHLGKEIGRLTGPKIINVHFVKPPERDGLGNLVPRLMPPTA
jgi:hypothetical protein